MYTHICVCLYIYIYIYVCIERERDWKTVADNSDDSD